MRSPSHGLRCWGLRHRSQAPAGHCSRSQALRSRLQGQTRIRLLENRLEQGYHALNEEQANIRAVRCGACRIGVCAHMGFGHTLSHPSVQLAVLPDISPMAMVGATSRSDLTHDLSSLTSRQPAGQPEPDVVACMHHRKHSARRAKVEGLRRERLLFDDVLRKADRAWEAQRGEMVALIQATASAHEQRQKVGIVQKGSLHRTTQYRKMSASRW